MPVAYGQLENFELLHVMLVMPVVEYVHVLLALYAYNGNLKSFLLSRDMQF
jgi:hypothetical protein